MMPVTWGVALVVMGYLEMCVNGMETFEKHSLLPNLGVRLKS